VGGGYVWDTEGKDRNKEVAHNPLHVAGDFSDHNNQIGKPPALPGRLPRV